MDAENPPRSILKNRSESTPSDPSDIEKNTALNAKEVGGDISIDGEQISSPSTRLKWDEANLYLTEQEKNSTMKITEPKTPYAPQYDPSEDADDIAMLDADEARGNGDSGMMSKMEDIPTIDIGSAEQEMEVDESSRRRKVSVSNGPPEDEEEVGSRTPEEEAKHRKFEKMRKEHYGGAAMALRRPSSDAITGEEEDEDDAEGR